MSSEYGPITVRKHTRYSFITEEKSSQLEYIGISLVSDALSKKPWKHNHGLI